MVKEFTIGPRVEVKALFFDRTAVTSAVSKMELKQLSRGGAIAMTRARQSIRSRKRASKPGQPISNRTGAYKSNIFFAFEPSSRAVVIGPARLNKPGLQPALHEFGGTQVAQADKVIVDGKDTYKITRGQTLHYEPRPVMRPTLEYASEKVPDLFKDALVGPSA